MSDVPLAFNIISHCTEELSEAVGRVLRLQLTMAGASVTLEFLTRRAHAIIPTAGIHDAHPLSTDGRKPGTGGGFWAKMTRKGEFSSLGYKATEGVENRTARQSRQWLDTCAAVQRTLTGANALDKVKLVVIGAQAVYGVTDYHTRAVVTRAAVDSTQVKI